ncbi:4-hydroxybenzoate polyprenyltransferase [Cnuella takakiae]|uniref:4-hydroxybenzoate polyprenyltransferase n=1 Tax=Cnuella takakiae TaxID=1302690 RepID=A0A1M4V192_9BACT|nr:geranylgeranylglycerol-phosphate geranylgeranyltransferase [Cnuella takakiae]OLY92736.1 ubiquinone biosynthesis protein UbiA [Cnuella takakiae]SHE62657.1 4-hydroxybenzoate polyprenyltransferase [Cnuella takakiae]
MRLVAAFMQMVRWPNLLFIALTQILFYSCLYLPLYGNPNWVQLGWLLAASLLIAAAGYIINDYFDLNIDQVNKPGQNVINRIISRRWAILFHLGLSTIGVVFTMLATRFDKWYLVLANAACVVLLWLYSTSLKRKLLIGNVLISLLTAWTVLILFFLKVPFSAAYAADEISSKFFRVSFLYGGFAFIISLIREAVKDIEDMIGDERYGCRTMPILVGIRATKIYIGVWTVVLIAALVVLQLYILQFGWYLAVIYCTLLVILPLVLFFKRLFGAYSPAEFGKLSSYTKWIMLAGIITMIFFRIYF